MPLVGRQTDNEYGCHDTVLSWKGRIGYFCSDFHQLDDDEVIAILDRFKPSGREAHSQTK